MLPNTTPLQFSQPPSPLRQRSMSALVLVLLTVGAVLSPLGFRLYVLVLGFGLAHEWARASKAPPATYVGITLTVALWEMMRTEALESGSIVFVIALLLRPLVCWLSRIKSPQFSLGQRCVFLSWSFYLYFSLSSIVFFYNALGELFTLWMIVILWLADSGAFFIGKIWGKRKLAPTISPGKTWVGFWGGIAIATLTGTCIVFLAVPHVLSPAKVVAFVGITATCAHLGDLLESAVKRYLNVKDMGHCIPGHGGLSDRFDSLLFVSFVLGLARAAHLVP